MNRTEFLAEVNSPKNIKAREEAVKFMNSLLSSQTELCRAYNLQQKQRLQQKYIEMKQRLAEHPQTEKKRYG